MKLFNITINWRDWKKRFLWALFLSLPIGILGTYLAGLLSDKTNRLLVYSNSSYHGGETVIDVTIQNAGDFVLCGLRVDLAFEKPPTYHISPKEYKQYTSLNASSFKLSLPSNIELETGQEVELRFTTKGANEITNLNSVPKSISAHCIISEEVHASWRRHFLLSNATLKEQIIVAVFIVMCITVLTLFYMVLLLRRATIKVVEQPEEHPQSEERSN